MSLVRFRLWAFSLLNDWCYGRVAQVVEHLTFNQVVRGSNPRTLTKKGIRMLVPFDIIYMDYADVAELADALDLGSSGRPCRFDSCHPQ